VIHAPATGETVYAATGRGCFYFDKLLGTTRPAQTSKVARLRDSLVLTTSVASFSKDRAPDAFDAYLQLQRAARLIRTWGDGYGYLMVATGRAEAMIDPEMNVWDMAALVPVIEEAGGRFSDWQGRRTIHSGEAVATNGLVGEEVLILLK
jgi:fructose-1,6-bisphosphatase/inositol monophosphatase family enzyme